MQKVVVAVPQILKVFSRVFIYKFHKKIVLDFLTLSISHSVSLDMLNNFCFHVYAEKSLFIAENCNAFSPSPVTLDVIEQVPS